MLRALLAASLLAFIGVGAAVPQPPAPAAGEWPVFRGTPQSTGVAVAELPDELVERWVFTCDKADAIESAPAVADGVVYVASADKHLYAVDLKTGTGKWKVKLKVMKASPAVKGNRVYVGDVEGNVYAIDANTGNKVWQYTPESGGEIVSGCNFYGDNILVAAQGMPVTCLNPKGEKVWEFAIDGGSNGCPTVSGDTVFASGCDSKFHAIDAKNGKEQWSIDIPGQAAATTAVADDVAYVGTVTNQVVAVDLKAKKVLWEFEAKVKAQPFYSSAAVTEELVILGSRDKKVYALDRKTGEPKWPPFVTEGIVDPSPVVAGGRVYVGCLSQTAEFYVLDVKTGKKKQELTLDGTACGSPAVAGDCLLVGTEKGKLYCLGKK
ncbi:MAG: PQQ-binding-like beta-propeller repeat protein [Fimbriiglobus sp.]|jgi:outer membrane protein assembly factor BamB|nr:PQQ-binding-like beta-propeller repeat protein [Fimbriiglobus sp.]